MRRITEGFRILALSAAMIAVTLAGCTLVPSEKVDMPPPEHPPGEAHKQVKHGHELYQADCAVCHGVTGQGNGPLAEDLRTVPADLTRIAQRRGGVFPEHEIHEIIDGRRRMRGHGPGNMPVWGDEYLRSDTNVVGGSSEVVVRMRILEIVDYLKSIQVGQ